MRLNKLKGQMGVLYVLGILTVGLGICMFNTDVSSGFVYFLAFTQCVVGGIICTLTLFYSPWNESDGGILKVTFYQMTKNVSIPKGTKLEGDSGSYMYITTRKGKIGFFTRLRCWLTRKPLPTKIEIPVRRINQ